MIVLYLRSMRIEALQALPWIQRPGTIELVMCIIDRDSTV